MKRKVILIFLALVAVALIFFYTKYHPAISTVPAETTPTPAAALSTSPFAAPISNALSRITKKPLGIYVSPRHSPVSPEKFTGYHTGVDFETFPNEQNTDVPIYAICDGKLLESQFGRGYGGMAVESCALDGKPITVVYGHIRLASVSVKIGGMMHKGEQFAVLGTGYSSETDGERKHLHLGIHLGSAIDTRGYVADKSLLSNWISIEDYLR